MASNITVSSLTATSVAGGVKLAWAVTDPNANGLPYRSLDAVEVWAATSNDRSGATKVGEGITDFFHNYLPVETFFYYWIKARDKEGSEGDWYPSGSTSGVAGGTIGLAGLSFSLMGGQIVTELDSGGDLTISIETASGNTPSSTEPVFVAFAQSTAGADVVGGYSIRQITSSLSITLDATIATGLGSETDPFNLHVCIFDNAGTPVLSVINCADSFSGDLEQGVSITPLSHMAPADTTTSVFKGRFYAASSLSDKYFRIIGRLVWDDGVGGSAWVLPDRIDLHSMDSKLPGDIIQEKVLLSGYSSSHTNQLIALDDTVPQFSEGDVLTAASLSIVPTCAGHVIECEASFTVTFSTAGYLMLALFRDSDATYPPEDDDAGAVAVSISSVEGSELIQLTLRHRELAGQKTQIGYHYRIGSDVNGTIYVNRIAAGDLFDGKMTWQTTVREIMA